MGETNLAITELLPLEDFFAIVFENKLLEKKSVKIQNNFETKILYCFLF